MISDWRISLRLLETQLTELESWTVYRFLTQHHPELEGDTALSALQRGKVEKVLAAAENTAGAFS